MLKLIFLPVIVEALFNVLPFYEPAARVCDDAVTLSVSDWRVTPHAVVLSTALERIVMCSRSNDIQFFFEVLLSSELKFENSAERGMDSLTPL